ncbi:uncharacterized protein M421DRAFT_411583, partial [Didymella exigua CBS 183.55]
TITTLTKRKTCKRQYVSNLVTKKEGSSYKEGKTPAKRVRAERRCGHCSKIRHNSYTCKVEIKDVDNRNTSK